MRGQYSELVESSKLNGDFKENFGKLIGAYLYLRSISAVRGRSLLWTGLISIAWSGALAWWAPRLAHCQNRRQSRALSRTGD